jgi:RNA polymerase sigma-B factor
MCSAVPMTEELLPNQTSELRAAVAERDDDAERIRRYHATKDRKLRDEILRDAQGIAVGLARRFRDRGAELDDLVQVAQLGLLYAIERFDPDRGVPFIGFATPTVLGELRKHFRTVWSVHMPRSLQEATQRLGPAVAELHHELGRSPTLDEIAVRMGVTREQVIEAMEASTAFRARSLDAPAPGSSGSALHATMASEHADVPFAQVDARETVAQLLPSLGERSRRIVELRFFHDLSQSEIAEAVGVSQMHVSRLLRQALEQMGALMGREVTAQESAAG